LGTLASKRWGNMRHDLDAVWTPFQKELLANQKNIEQQAMELYNPKKPAKTIELLTKYTNEQANKAIKMAWDLGDSLWTKYDGLW
jgi:dipeptidase